MCLIYTSHVHSSVFLLVISSEIGHNLNLAHSGGLNGRTYTGKFILFKKVHKMCMNMSNLYIIPLNIF